MGWWLNLAAFLGIAILSVPVLSSNHRRRKAARAPDGSDAQDPDIASLMSAAKGRASAWVTDWRWFEEKCLYVGYTLLLGSSFLRLFLST